MLHDLQIVALVRSWSRSSFYCKGCVVILLWDYILEASKTLLPDLFDGDLGKGSSVFFKFIKDLIFSLKVLFWGLWSVFLKNWGLCLKFCDLFAVVLVYCWFFLANFPILVRLKWSWILDWAVITFKCLSGAIFCSGV